MSLQAKLDYFRKLLPILRTIICKIVCCCVFNAMGSIVYAETYQIDLLLQSYLLQRRHLHVSEWLYDVSFLYLIFSAVFGFQWRNYTGAKWEHALLPLVSGEHVVFFFCKILGKF